MRATAPENTEAIKSIIGGEKPLTDKPKGEGARAKAKGRTRTQARGVELGVELGVQLGVQLGECSSEGWARGKTKNKKTQEIQSRKEPDKTRQLTSATPRLGSTPWQLWTTPTLL